jgi:hypothetical protein
LKQLSNRSYCTFFEGEVTNANFGSWEKLSSAYSGGLSWLAVHSTRKLQIAVSVHRAGSSVLRGERWQEKRDTADIIAGRVGRIRPNERFSGGGHRRHVCRDCQKLGRAKLSYLQEVRNIDRCLNFLGGVHPHRKAAQELRAISEPFQPSSHGYGAKSY